MCLRVEGSVGSLIEYLPGLSKMNVLTEEYPNRRSILTLSNYFSGSKALRSPKDPAGKHSSCAAVG